jgi:predicted deacylase
MATNETIKVEPKHYSYEKYLWHLLTHARRHKLPFEIIGSEKSNRTGVSYPLYRFIIHPRLSGTVCIVAGIHGNEIAGPLCILRLIDTMIHALPQDFRYIIYPLINPTGFDLRQRFDSNRRDLNAIDSVTLKSKNYVEVQAFYQDAIQFAPFEAVITLHEDSDRFRFYMYGLGKKNVPYYHAVCAFAKTFIPPWVHGEIDGHTTDEHGFILATAHDRSFDAALYSHGLARKAFTFETPGKLDCRFRADVMTQLVLQSLYLLSGMCWMEKKRPPSR